MNDLNKETNLNCDNKQNNTCNINDERSQKSIFCSGGGEEYKLLNRLNMNTRNSINLSQIAK